MPRPKWTREECSQYGKEGGKLSGIRKRDKIFEQFEQIIRDKGVYEAVVLAYRRGWKNGYTTCENKHAYYNKKAS